MVWTPPCIVRYKQKSNQYLILKHLIKNLQISIFPSFPKKSSNLVVLKDVSFSFEPRTYKNFHKPVPTHLGKKLDKLHSDKRNLILYILPHTEEKREKFKWNYSWNKFLTWIGSSTTGLTLGTFSKPLDGLWGESTEDWSWILISGALNPLLWFSRNSCEVVSRANLVTRENFSRICIGRSRAGSWNFGLCLPLYREIRDPSS